MRSLYLSKENNENKEGCLVSYPIKFTSKCIRLTENESSVELCSFVGITLDILIGLIYLLKKHSNACSTVSSNFIKNNDLCKYLSTIGIRTDSKCEFLNFEITWIYKKLFFAEEFYANFKKCLNNPNIRFVIIPLGIALQNGSHANYLIFDKKTYQIERFEPYGSDSPYKFNYNSNLLDNVLQFKFNEINEDIKYIQPKKYLPKIAFQYFDVYESKTEKIGDPGGFCALWSIWYTDMRMTYPDIDRKTLVKKLLKQIRSNNVSFKTLIRNYSVNITKMRDEVLSKAKININHWINDQYTEEQFNLIIKEIIGLL